MKDFIGREKELGRLELLLQKNSSSLVVIRGRRRVGKSRLIQEFCKGKPSFMFSGLPPSVGTNSAQQQREEFAQQFAQLTGVACRGDADWSDLFWSLAQQVQSGQTIIVFDEISWMGSKDPLFLGKLKNAWDLHFSKNPKLILILCGSVSSWIEKNILMHTGFLGRVSVDMQVRQLPLRKCKEFWRNSAGRISSYEMFKVLAVTGGIPKYLEEVISNRSAEDNIQRLCFNPDGILFREFNQIFSDLFSRRSHKYRAIVMHLVGGSSTLEEIAQSLELKKGGAISSYLHDLELADFIRSDYTWNIRTGKVSSLRKYRLSDNYLRFYLKYILPNRKKILAESCYVGDLTASANWLSIMGYQFQNLVLANTQLLLPSLGISLRDIEMFNPFFQRRTQRHKGCEIDLLIQTKQRCLYICEIKFSQAKIGASVGGEIREKMQRLALPRGFSVRTALVHVNGVTDALRSTGLVDHFVDFSELLD